MRGLKRSDQGRAGQGRAEIKAKAGRGGSHATNKGNKVGQLNKKEGEAVLKLKICFYHKYFQKHACS